MNSLLKHRDDDACVYERALMQAILRLILGMRVQPALLARYDIGLVNAGKEDTDHACCSKRMHCCCKSVVRIRS